MLVPGAFAPGTSELDARARGFREASNALRGGDGVNRARDQLAGSRPMIVGETTLEQLGVGQNHAQLVVQLVEQAR